MLNIFSILKKQFNNAIKVIALEHSITLSEDDLKNFTVEPIKDKKNGDIACNIAMTLIKKFKDCELKNVELLANEITAQILKINNSVNEISSVDRNLIHEIKVAKAGFINIFLTQKTHRKKSIMM